MAGLRPLAGAALACALPLSAWAGGELDAQAIRAVLEPELPALRACYELALADGGRVEGSVLARFTVDGRGRVKGAAVLEVGRTLQSPAVCRCMEQRLRTLKFPPPPDGQEQPVEMPLNLKAVE